MRGLASAAIVIAMLTGCASSQINDKLADGAKEASKEEPWFDRVEDWDDGNFGTIEVKTDFLESEVESYEPAVEICEAFVKQYAPDADDKPNLQIYGIERETSTKVDGSVETSDDEIIIAQAVITTGYKCGANPPSKLRDKVKALGVKVN